MAEARTMGMSADRGLWLSRFLEARTIAYHRDHGWKFENRVLKSIWPVRAKWAGKLASWLFDQAEKAEPGAEDNPGWPTRYPSWAWATLGCTVQAWGEWRNRKP